MEQLETLLRTSGNRLTTPRQKVFAVLQQAAHPLSLQQLSLQCRGVDRTSIYRTLELYEQLHIIEIVHVGWKKRYELADPFKPHHHHLQCTNCHELIAIDTPELEQLIETIAEQHCYTITGHHFELQGICSRCKLHHSVV